MGILGLTDPGKVKSFTSLPEVSNMGTSQLQMYVDRAEFMTSRLHDYDNTLPSYAIMMEYAIDLLTENLIIINIPAFRRSAIAKVRAEQIGSYSYSKDTKTGDDPNFLTPELMMILEAFRIGTDPKVAFSTTEMFIRRSISVDSSGRKYYVPEDARNSIGVEDPPLPLGVRDMDTPL